MLVKWVLLFVAESLWISLHPHWQRGSINLSHPIHPLTSGARPVARPENWVPSRDSTTFGQGTSLRSSRPCRGMHAWRPVKGICHKHTPIPPHPDGHACVMHAEINESTCQLSIFASAPSKHDGLDGRVAHVARLGCGRAGTGHHLKRVACAGSLPDSIPPLNSQHFINSLCHISTLYIPCAPSDPSPAGPKDAELLWRRGDGATMTDGTMKLDHPGH